MTSILAANALTTYSEAKARLSAIGVAIVDGTDQVAVERLVNAVSDAVEGYCGRSFAYVAGDTSRQRVPDGTRLWLPRCPVASVTSIAIDGATVAAADYELEDADTGTVYAEGGWGGASYEDPVPIGETLPGTGPRSLVATYSGGYVTPSQGAASPTGGATLSTRTGSGAGTVTGTAGADATGTLAVYVEPDGENTNGTIQWNGVLGYSWSGVPTPEVDLGSVSTDLLGLTWSIATAPGVAPLEESWSVVPTVAAPTRTLPYDLEEAVLVAVAVLWRQRAGGWASDVMPEQNAVIGRGTGGLLPDSVLPWLARYRRGDG